MMNSSFIYTLLVIFLKFKMNIFGIIYSELFIEIKCLKSIKTFLKAAYLATLLNRQIQGLFCTSSQAAKGIKGNYWRLIRLNNKPSPLFIES